MLRFRSRNRARWLANSIVAGNSAQVLSIGVFFSLMIIGLSGSLSTTLVRGSTEHGISPSVAARAASEPPVSIVFSAFLGYKPIRSIVGSKSLSQLAPVDRQSLTGSSFFSNLISAPFHAGLGQAFTFAAIICVVAAIASRSRGGKYIHTER